MSAIPSWYVVIALVWAAYQGIRGIVETRFNNRGNELKQWQKVIVFDIHDFAFRFVCTVAGFVSLYTAYNLMREVDIRNISPGAAVVLGLSFLIGVMGVGGQLHFAVLMGRLPSAK
jgi:hypothetical protein